jgi:hypothetical protein
LSLFLVFALGFCNKFVEAWTSLKFVTKCWSLLWVCKFLNATTWRHVGPVWLLFLQV